MVELFLATAFESQKCPDLKYKLYVHLIFKTLSLDTPLPVFFSRISLCLVIPFPLSLVREQGSKVESNKEIT